jgi:peptide/nickel transport system ATP-binding protein
LQGLPGSVPNLFTPPPGCRLAPRCPHAEARCSAAFPATVTVARDHQVACVLAHPQASEAA